MQGGFFSYALLGALAIALLFAAFTDLRRRRIDNWLTAAIALGAPLFWLASGTSLLDVGFQFALAAITFIFMAALFAMRGMGGGDVKLLTAIALWIPPIPYVTLLIVMAVAGALVSIAAVAWHVGRRREGRTQVPYGIAISAAGLWVLATHYLPGMQAILR